MTESLVRSQQARGDLDGLYRTYYGSLVLSLRRVLNSVDDAEEVAQQAFIRFLETGETTSPRSERAWLFHLGRNLAIDHLRRRTLYRRILDEEAAPVRGTPLLNPVEQPDPESACLSRDAAFRVRQLLQDLSPKCRATFLDSKAHEKTYPEIAAERGCSISLVEKQVSSGLRHVRRHLPREAALAA